MVSQKDVINDVYTAAAVTAGAFGVSKLTVAVGLGTLLVKTLQEKKYIPEYSTHWHLQVPGSSSNLSTKTDTKTK